MTTSKIQEGKNFADRDFTLAVSAYPDEPRSSGSGREAERHWPSEESTTECHSGSHLGHHQCFMAIHEDDSVSDSDSDGEELVNELRKMSNRSQTTIIEMVKKVMKQDQEIERQEKLLSDKEEEIKSLALVEKKNQALTAQVDELTSKHMDLQALRMELKCSNEKLVESYAMLEVAHEVMIIMMKSYQPIDSTCSHNDNKEKQSCFKKVIVEDLMII
jgi:hypothetical protein